MTVVLRPDDEDATFPPNLMAVGPPVSDDGQPDAAHHPHRRSPGAASGLGGLVLDRAGLTTREGKRLVRDVSFRVEPGERLAIVGPNGAGKTSLLRLLCGMAVPSSGAVLLDGQPIHLLPAMERARRIAVVSQAGQPDLRLSVQEYVSLGRIPHRGRVPQAAHQRAVFRALSQVGLSGLAARRLEHLSGGERQRAAIARAVAQEPVLLLLDEPTNHLDPRARADVLDLAACLGATVIAILHDLDRVAPFADRVAVMAQGTLVAHGPAEEALAPATVRFVFNMDCFTVANPSNGRNLLVFDLPSP